MRWVWVLSAATLAVIAALTPVACGGQSAAPPPALPLYSRHEAALFDDAIDPRVLGVGYDAPNVSPRGDGALFERAQIGDCVVRGRIDSVTVKGAGDSTRIDLGIRVTETLRARNGFDAKELTLAVDRSSPSFNMVKSIEDRMSGHDMIAFIRAYANESGEGRLHFHLVPDDPAIAQAVREAVSLDKVPLGDGGAGAPPPSK